ncbi:MAG: 5-(carboxyamino)imidazole ribonucleotide mutase [Verrucomicrobia bacterium]|nr:5-(carboxyamino)imidazole ribonucleotide mutase [Verrucomicrobiota bacterium]MDA1065194.1 5-(carboxyamino)imidazole ribonucleotide mutase [Verrucomicrobiota bacterium]
MALTISPKVGIVMGSISDWPVFKHSAKILDVLGVSYDKRVLSAHRTPKELEAWLRECEEAGVQVFIAAAGGAAHLAGVVASLTILPVLAVPMESNLLGLDSLLSMVQMPGGIPVPTMGIGKAGSTNAGLSAAAIIALGDPTVREALIQFRKDQAAKVLSSEFPED